MSVRPMILITTRFDHKTSDFAARDAYAEAVSRAGGTPVQAREHSELADALRTGNTDNIDALAAVTDGLILSGGDDIEPRLYGQARHPATSGVDKNCDAAEIALCRAFISRGKPVLGICRGMQALNVAMGGDLIQDIPARFGLERSYHSDRAQRHSIDVEVNSWLGKLFGGSMMVNSTHHQCVDRLADGFAAAAHAGPVIEAMERGDALGVQFHPERMLDEGMLPIFEDFIGRCKHAPVV